MDDQRVGAVLRAVRLRKRWWQRDVAAQGGVSRGLISLLERGHLDRVSLAALRRVAATLDVRVDVVARWRGGELDRLLNAGHSALHESVARLFSTLPGWVPAPEVSFSIYGERGVMDILAWHSQQQALLVIELKTAVVDVQALVGTVDRYRRLAPVIARERGWTASSVSVWVLFREGKTNRRRVAAHRTMLHAAFPYDGRKMRGWLRCPDRAIAALSFWSDANPGSARACGGVPAGR